jgi:8-oxo-dGTP pyrophosphatase MutT (NUDIX family)
MGFSGLIKGWHDSVMHRQPILTALADYRSRYPEEADVVDRFEVFVRGEPRCFHNDCWSGHITGSAWVLDSAGKKALLTHHKKLGKWLQLGGHSDGDPDTLAVALREAHEESGLAVTALDRAILDLDVHQIPARGGEPAHFHFDVRYLLQVAGAEAFAVSDESHELAWVAPEELETFSREWSVLRMAEKARVK